MSIEEEILESVAKYYLTSRDFNGLPLRIIKTVSKKKLKSVITSLIQQDKVSLVFGDTHPNPYIKAFWDESKETQIQKLNTLNLEHTCIYPSATYLKEVVDSSKYEGEPFTLLLALGEPQLAFKPFDLSVLESYRNDPRYSYHTNDISGHLSISDKYYEDTKVAEADRILLQTFGFAYDSEWNRAVAVFLTYLSDLSPEHQQIWKAKILADKYKLHPDYYRTAILGQFPEGISVFDAFIEELKCINDLCKLIGQPLLFKNDFHAVKPRAFGFLIRPTSKEYCDFIHLLDKLISENINREFFVGVIPIEEEHTRKDGKVEVRLTGTLQMLEEWLKKTFIPEDKKPMEEMIQTFKEIRKLRQKPAHAIDDNTYDQKYIKEQRELMKRAYTGIRLIRLIFENHPSTKEYEIPDVIKEGNRIWIY